MAQDPLLRKALITWRAMNDRVLKHKSYVGTVICEEWKNSTNFVEWYYKQKKEDGWHLDKDLLSDGDVKVYSPDTCVFLPQELNKMLHSGHKNKASGLPLGVFKCWNKYRTKIKDGSGGEWWDAFDTIEEAAQAYVKKKSEFIRNLTEKYKDRLDIKAYNKLIELYGE